MTFGAQTVTLRSFTDGTTRDRLNQPIPDEHDVTLTGVLMRPFRPTEVVTMTDVATNVWRCTAPPVAEALAATAADVLLYDDDPFQITGVEPFYDLAGAVSHVRITCQKQAL